MCWYRQRNDGPTAGSATYLLPCSWRPLLAAVAAASTAALLLCCCSWEDALKWAEEALSLMQQTAQPTYRCAVTDCLSSLLLLLLLPSSFAAAAGRML
jgi:hypothetical protein